VKLFLDSANLQDVEANLARGHISGITTNPSLLAKEPKSNFFGHINKIVDLIRASGNLIPLSAEVFAIKPDEMIAQAQEIRQKVPYENLNIKVPIGWDELRVMSTLAKKGIDVNCTCIFTEAQAVLAADAGAKYVSIFFCRLRDIGGDPVSVIRNTRDVLDMGQSKAEIIVGSIRSAYDVMEAQIAGAHIVTAGPKILQAMASHPQTDASVQGFMRDFEAWIK
jgi:transaldolase